MDAVALNGWKVLEFLPMEDEEIPVKIVRSALAFVPQGIPTVGDVIFVVDDEFVRLSEYSRKNPKSVFRVVGPDDWDPTEQEMRSAVFEPLAEAKVQKVVEYFRKKAVRG